MSKRTATDSIIGDNFITLDDELNLFAQNKLRKIYNAKSLDVYSLNDIEEARIKLLRYKTPLMTRLDWLVHELARYLTECLIKRENYLNDSRAETLDIREILRVGYKTIMSNNDTTTLEYHYLVFAKALHEWLFRFQFGKSAKLKKKNERQWWSCIENMANSLVDELNQYDEKKSYDSYSYQQDTAKPMLSVL